LGLEEGLALAYQDFLTTHASGREPSLGEASVGVASVIDAAGGDAIPQRLTPNAKKYLDQGE
jgi:hypothetical protein